MADKPQGERQTPDSLRRAAPPANAPPGLATPADAAVPAPPSVDADAIVARSPDVTGRTIADKYILVPLRRGMGEENHLYTCNAVGREAWELMDGRVTVRDLAATIAARYDAPADTVAADLLVFLGELATIGAVVVRRSAER